MWTLCILSAAASAKKMKVEESVNGFDYYSTKVEAGTEKILYFFEIQYGRLTCYYNKLGGYQGSAGNVFFRHCPRIPYSGLAKGAVMYQIYVDRFCNGDPSNDVQTGEYSYIREHVAKVEDWYRPPQKYGCEEFLRRRPAGGLLTNWII